MAEIFLESKTIFPAAWLESVHALEVEIGCGRGKFLLDRAGLHPEINFLGIDRVAKWMRRSTLRAEKQQIGNLLFVKSDVREVLLQIPAGSVSVFHIYFPDPWPKRRHRSRRLVTPDFLALLSHRLGPGGLVEMATDDADYFLQMKKSAEQTQVFWGPVRASDGRLFGGVSTHYENRFASRSLPLYYLELKKKGPE